MHDPVKRQRLFVHSKSLTERKKNLQNRLLEQEDFRPLLEAFPCWCVTTYAASGSLPLKPGLFDVAIIDEASQMTTSESVGAIARGNQVVIAGDDQQLPPTAAPRSNLRSIAEALNLTAAMCCLQTRTAPIL